VAHRKIFARIIPTTSYSDTEKRELSLIRIWRS